MKGHVYNDRLRMPPQPAPAVFDDAERRLSNSAGVRQRSMTAATERAGGA